MKAVGTRAFSSFLTNLLLFVWYSVACGLGLTVVVVAVSTFVDVPGLTAFVSAFPPNASVTLASIRPGQDLTIVAFPPGIDFHATPVAGVPGLKTTIPVSFSVDSAAHRMTAPSLGIDVAEVQNVSGSLTFSARTGTFFAGNGILLIAVLALVLFVIGQLRTVLRTLGKGQPFVPTNAARIRSIGYVVIVGEIARAVVVLCENYYAMTHFSADGLRFGARLELNGFAIVSGLIILAIAEVFRAGTRLDEEQSLTV